MDRLVGLKRWRILLSICVGSMLAAAPAFAKIHVIQFGGTFGLSYSPATTTVAIGDTVEWDGDFSTHPLSSSTIPNGASAFGWSSGTQFRYVVTVAGSYLYYCQIHGDPSGSGMAGTFTASVTGVAGSGNSSLPSEFVLEQNYPNPFNPSTGITFEVPSASNASGRAGVAGTTVSLKVYDIAGREVATLAQGVMLPGTYVVRFDGTELSSGVYLYRLRAEGVSIARRMVLLK